MNSSVFYQGWFEKCQLYTLSDFLQNDIANWFIADFENLKYHIFFFVEQPILGVITGLIKEQGFNNWYIHVQYHVTLLSYGPTQGSAQTW